jgi:oleandomycin transport system permease protein
MTATATTLTTASPPPAPPVAVRARRGPSTLRHSATLAWRGVTKTIHSTEALLDVTLQPIIFLLLFVYVFGGAISGNTADYLQFALPGVLVQTVVFASAGTGVALADDLSTGIFDRFRSLPISRAAPLVGAVLGDVVRYGVLCVITLGFGYVLGFRAQTSVPEVLAACLLVIAFALCLSWISVLIGMLARTPGAVQGIVILIMFPLTFGTSIFVPASTLPGWLQSFTHVNPLTHLVNTLRGLMLGGPVQSDLLWTLAWMGILLAVFVPLALRAYRRRA